MLISYRTLDRLITGFTVLLYAAILCLFVFIGFALFAEAQASEETVPTESNRFRRELTRIVQQEWGLDGAVALHAAQIHQESGWRTNVTSPAGAEGLSQFMPSTSAWIAEIYPDLGEAAPYSAGWAMRAMTRYNRWHWTRLTAIDACNRWAFTLSAYNGGLSWVRRDKRLAAAASVDPKRWFCSVELFTDRAAWARRENRDYVERILRRWEPMYVHAGWSPDSVCGSI